MQQGMQRPSRLLRPMQGQRDREVHGRLHRQLWLRWRRRQLMQPRLFCRCMQLLWVPGRQDVPIRLPIPPSPMRRHLRRAGATTTRADATYIGSVEVACAGWSSGFMLIVLDLHDLACGRLLDQPSRDVPIYQVDSAYLSQSDLVLRTIRTYIPVINVKVYTLFCSSMHMRS
jgi:hypothetical protein